MSANTPEPINNEQLLEVDYLVKQNLYGVIKTDGFISSGNTTTTPGNEFYSYKQVIRSDSIWINSKDLVINGTNSVYANRRSLQCADMNASGTYGTNNPSLVGRAWATNISNWISPEFNITFTIIAYIGLISNASTFPNTLSNFSQIDTTAYPYIFNYGAGVLTFIGNIPPNLYPNASKTYALFINGYIYTGDLGLFSSNTSIVTSNITSASITTQNNSINAGSGSIYTSNIYLTGNLYSSNGLPYSSGIGQNTNITSLTINTQNNTINIGSGTFYGANVQATNISEVFINISQNTYIASLQISSNQPASFGSVSFTISFTGNANSTGYTYTVLNTTLGTTIQQPTTVYSSTASFSSTFPYGQYILSVNANTNGTGSGSIASTTYTINIPDPIGQPALFIANTANISVSGQTITVSGIPYFTSNAYINFAQNSLGFSNTSNIQPSTSLSTFLILGDTNNYLNQSNYIYANFAPLPNYNTTSLNTNSIQYIFNSNQQNISSISTQSTPTPLTLKAVLSNINSFQSYPNGIPINLRGTSYLNSIAYLSTSINESNLFSTNPYSITRYSILDSANLSGTNSLIPTLSQIQKYPAQKTTATMTANDALYSVYDQGYYQSLSNMYIYSNTNLFLPPQPPISYSSSANHHNLLFQFTPQPSQRFLSFYITLQTNTNAIGRIFINWNNNEWYDANANASSSPSSFNSTLTSGSCGTGINGIATPTTLTTVTNTTQIQSQTYYIKAPKWSFSNLSPIYVNIYLNTNAYVSSNIIIGIPSSNLETAIPSVSIINRPTISQVSPSTNIYISGIPFYTSPTSISFQLGYLLFTNIYRATLWERPE